MRTFIRKLQQIDWWVVVVLALIASIGAAVLFSAAEGSFDPWAWRHIMRFSVCVAILACVAIVDIRYWRSYAYILYGVSLILLIGVEVMGSIGMGAQRWIDLYVVVLQPSEIMKITLLMALARYFHGVSPQEMNKPKTLAFPLFLTLFPTLLVLRQPDLGTAMLLMVAGFSIFFAAGLSWWIIGGGLALVAAAMPVLWSMMYAYQRERVLTFLDPGRDALGSGYNILQSNIALGSGGLWGKGFGHGSQAHLNFLPEKQTDFIFAMFCEEFGVFGGVTLLSLYTVLILYGYKVSFMSRSAFGRFLGIGLTTLFFLYVFVNTAMVMGMVPVVGVPLPLVSYGGTAMLTLMMGLGLLISIAIYRDVRMGR
ncbi:MAG: rod shape-determining protein RodA [Holosporales bacterium]